MANEDLILEILKPMQADLAETRRRVENALRRDWLPMTIT